jgi:hypothetical protein
MRSTGHTSRVATAAFVATCLAAALCAPLPAAAQTTQSLTFYGAGLMIDGTARVGDRSADVSVSIDEFIDNLEMGGLAAYRVETATWTVAVEGAFFGLGQSQGDLSMDVDMTIAELDAGYRLSPTIEAFLGVRYTDLSAEVATTRPVSGEPFHAQGGDDFLDPIVGLRFAAPLSDRWTMQGQGDVGGFGVGMDLQWQAKLDIGFRPSETVTIWLGYRALDQEFEDAGARERFDMDVTYQGPELGVTFSF